MASSPPLKTCFWTGRRYNWTGATADQLRLRDQDTMRRMRSLDERRESDSLASPGAIQRSLYAVCIPGAVASGNVAHVRKYLAQGVDPNTADSRGGNDPLIVTASSHGHAAIVQLLLEHRARVDEPARGDTALVHASGAGHTEIVSLLLAAGASVHGSVWTKTGATPLLRASVEGHAPCVQMLVDAGAHVNTPSPKGEYPLHSAARMGHADVVRILLAAGADRSVTVSVGGRSLTPLQCSEKHDDCVTLLRACDRMQSTAPEK